MNRSFRYLIFDAVAPLKLRYNVFWSNFTFWYFNNYCEKFWCDWLACKNGSSANVSSMNDQNKKKYLLYYVWQKKSYVTKGFQANLTFKWKLYVECKKHLSKHTLWPIGLYAIMKSDPFGGLNFPDVICMYATHTIRVNIIICRFKNIFTTCTLINTFRIFSLL